MKKLMFCVLLLVYVSMQASQWEVRGRDGVVKGTLAYSLIDKTASWRYVGDDAVLVGTCTTYNTLGAVYCCFFGNDTLPVLSFTFFLTPAKNIPLGSPMMDGWCKEVIEYPVLMIRY